MHSLSKGSLPKQVLSVTLGAHNTAAGVQYSAGTVVRAAVAAVVAAAAAVGTSGTVSQAATSAAAADPVAA